MAVGRAIVRKPKVFLFDEQLSNLDAKLRVQMRAELSKLHTRLQATMIYVTHDQVEAMTMGEKIVVMKNARIQQISDSKNPYDKPVNKFVAGFIGSPSMNFIEGIIEEKWKLFGKKIEEMDTRLRDFNNRIIGIEQKVNQIASERKSEVERIEDKIDTYKDSMSEVTGRMQSVEGAMKDSLTPMMQTLRSLSEDSLFPCPSRMPGVISVLRPISSTGPRGA